MEQPTSNEGLREKYNEIYADGPENFHTFTDEDIQAAIFATRKNWNHIQVLEVGCGEGDLAASIAASGGSVMGIDYSGEAIKTAREKHKEEIPGGRLAFYEADLSNHASKDYDVVIASEVIEHTDDPQEFMKQLAALTISGGEIIVTCPSFWNVRGIVWMTLRTLLDVPMTLTDLHFLTPDRVEIMGVMAGLTPGPFTSMRHSVGFGLKMEGDLRRRLTLTLSDWAASSSGRSLPNNIEDRIEKLLGFLIRAGSHLGKVDSDLVGATLIARFRKKQ